MKAPNLAMGNTCQKWSGTERTEAMITNSFRRVLGLLISETALRSFLQDPHLENPNLTDEYQWARRITVNSHTTVMCKQLNRALRQQAINYGGLPGPHNTCLVFIASRYKGNWKVYTEGPKT